MVEELLVTARYNAKVDPGLAIWSWEIPVYLFLGGFVLVLAIARWGLDRRIAFMTLRLVVTPPNAIVFGTGLVRMPDMMKAGLWLNLTGILLIFALTYSVFIPVLGLLH